MVIRKKVLWAHNYKNVARKFSTYREKVRLEDTKAMAQTKKVREKIRNYKCIYVLSKTFTVWLVA